MASRKSVFSFRSRSTSGSNLAAASEHLIATSFCTGAPSASTDTRASALKGHTSTHRAQVHSSQPLDLGDEPAHVFHRIVRRFVSVVGVTLALDVFEPVRPIAH